MFKKMKPFNLLAVSMALLFGATPAAFAQVAVDIGTAGTGFFAGLVNFMQEIVDFMSGPYAIFAIIMGGALAIGLWIFTPKESGVMQWVFRVLFGGIMLLNLGGIVAYVAGMAT